MLDEQRSITYWQDKWEEVFVENRKLIKELAEATKKLNEFNKIIRELKKVQKEINAVKKYNGKVRQSGADRIDYISPEEWKKRETQRF